MSVAIQAEVTASAGGTPLSSIRERKAAKRASAPTASGSATLPTLLKEVRNANAEASSSKHAAAAATVTVVPASVNEHGTMNGDAARGGRTKRRHRKDRNREEDPAHDKHTERTTNIEAELEPSSGSKAKSRDKGAVEKISTDEWECVSLAQSEVSRIPPVWTPDGRFYITVQNSSILVHNASAPYERKSTLLVPVSGRGSTGGGRINALLKSPLNPSHILTAAEDGYVRVWDVVSGKIVHAVQVPKVKLRHMCIGKIGETWTIFVASVPANIHHKSTSSRILHFPYPTDTQPQPEARRLNKLSSIPTALFISPSSAYLVALAANKAYTFLLPASPTSPDWTAQLVKFVSDQPLTCGAFAPADRLASASGNKSEEWFATGDEMGVIRLWHGLGQAFRLLSKKDRDSGKTQANSEMEKRLPTTSLRWHAHAVAALAFTPSGSQLLSVGEESVLVQWHLGSGRREYVPRLGGRPIVSLAVKDSARGREEEWWMAFADGSVVKVGAGSGRIENVGDGVKIDPLRQVDFDSPYPLALHPSTSALVLPSSNPGTLQFIDPLQSSLLFDLEVAPSNRVSRRDDKELTPVAVERVAFSDATQGKSEWMATVEGRKGDEWEGGGEVRNLKLWRWDGQRYIVNTQFPRPHGTATISSLAFTPLGTPTSPSRPYLLTTAHDGSAKLWQVRQAKKSEHGKAATKRATTFEFYWSPRSTWTYRSLPIYSASFSPDSTIVALAHGSVVSLWDTESNVLLRALDCGAAVAAAAAAAAGTSFHLLAFGGASGRYLLAGGSGGIICWDLLSCELTWIDTGRNISNLMSVTGGNIITTELVTSKTIISSWTPGSINGAPSRSITVSQRLRSLVHLPSSAPSTSKIQPMIFAAVSTEGDLFRLGDGISALTPVAASLHPVATQEKEKLSIWQEMFGQHAFVDPSNSPALPDGAPSSLTVDRTRDPSGRASAVYDGPSHTLPPASMLFDGFMEEILASGPLATTAQEALEPDILYDHEPQAEDIGDPEMLERSSRAREVDDKQVKELQEFFTDLLDLRARAKDKMGKGKLLNGTGPSSPTATLHPGNGVSDTADQEELDDDETLVNGSSTVTKAPLTPNTKSSLVKQADEEDEDRVVKTPMTGSVLGSAAGKKGKKRRAPKDAE